MSMLGSMHPPSRILLVWMLRICTRPFSSGRPISTWTSKRPGRSSAESIMSRRLVIPMSKTLLSELTPSILASSWLTTESPTPVPSLLAPRWRQIASISSKMITCSSLSSPADICSSSASAKSSRTFFSLSPTYFERMSGPDTILGSRAVSPPCSTQLICRAMRVLPVPGGPCSIIPRTCLIPSFFTTSGGRIRDTKARRKMSPNSLSRPPMPSFSKSVLIMLLADRRETWPASLSGVSPRLLKVMLVLPMSKPPAPALSAATISFFGSACGPPAESPLMLGTCAISLTVMRRTLPR
mmetsp:Transcript_15755/g.39742  ORF Transcript_15755/g.39742 Transcript_15755/m.39742 type:complete len:297 (+) Transcript_15755:892-1782(+)